MVTRLEGTPEELVKKVQAAMLTASAARSRHVVALLIVDETSSSQSASAEEFAQWMVEAEADTVSVGRMNDSREAMYTRMDGE